MLKADVLKALEGRDGVAQLVKHYDQCNPKKFANAEVLIQVKYDGIQLNVVRCDDGALFLGRSGKELYLPEEIKALLLATFRPDVMIGELIFAGKTLEELSGLVNPNRVTPWTQQEIDEAVDGLHFMVFDCLLDTDEFLNGHSPRLYIDRLGIARTTISYGHNITVVSNITVCSVLSDDLIEDAAQKAIDSGHEGVVLRVTSADWKAGRRDHNAMKIVRGIHLDLKCTDFKYGKGKRSEQIAALEFEYKGRKFWSDLGKGWTDEKRDELTAQSERTMYNEVRFPIGEIFHVKGLQESSKGVIRLPKVQEHRIDKDVQDE